MSTQGDKLKAIADAIRAMDGTSGKIAANHFPARIRAISENATAAAGDIASGKTAFVKGKMVTGTVETVLSGSKVVNSGYAVPYVSGGALKVDGYRGQDTLYRANGMLTVDSQLSEYGDAAAGDVAEGKTFTSAAGLKVVGTAKTQLIPAHAEANIETGIITIDGIWETIVGSLYADCADGSATSGMFAYLYVPTNSGNNTPLTRFLFQNGFGLNLSRTYTNGNTELSSHPDWKYMGDITRIISIDAFVC